MPRRTVPRRSTSALAARIAALEERVARLEAGRPPPGDGRTSRVRATAGRAAAGNDRRSKVTRCAGCGLPLRRRNGRCAECGRPLDA